MSEQSSDSLDAVAETQGQINIRGVLLKLVFLFAALTLFNIAAFSTMAFENQIDLIIDNVSANAMNPGRDVQYVVEDEFNDTLQARRDEILDLLASENPDWVIWVPSEQTTNPVPDTETPEESVENDESNASENGETQDSVTMVRRINDDTANEAGIFLLEALSGDMVEALNEVGYYQFILYSDVPSVLEMEVSSPTATQVLFDSAFADRENSVLTGVENSHITKSITHRSLDNKLFYLKPIRSSLNFLWNEPILVVYIPIQVNLIGRSYVVKMPIETGIVQELFRNFVVQSGLFAGLMLTMHLAFVIVAYRLLIRPMQEANSSLSTTNSTLDRRNKEMVEELEIARKVQEAILPKVSDIQHSSIRLGQVYVSLEAVSGDYLDVISMDDNHLGLLVVDVSGHGVPSALVTTMAKVAFNNHASPELDPKEVCRLVNIDLCRAIGDSDYYCTAIYGLLNVETKLLRFSCCGHPPAVWWKNDEKETAQLSTRGFNLGTAEFARFQQADAQLHIGDKLLFFSDGVTEAENEAGEMYDDHNLMDFVKRNHNLSADQLSKLIVQDVFDFTGKAPQGDDITLIAVDIL